MTPETTIPYHAGSFSPATRQLAPPDRNRVTHFYTSVRVRPSEGASAHVRT